MKPSTLSYTPEIGKDVLDLFARNMNLPASAEALGISGAEVSIWLSRSNSWDEEEDGENPFYVVVGGSNVLFSEAIENVYDSIAFSLEAEGFRRAICGHEEVVVSKGQAVMVPDDQGKMVPMMRVKHDNNLLLKMLASNSRKYGQQAQRDNAVGVSSADQLTKTGVLAIPMIATQDWGKALADHRKVIEDIDPSTTKGKTVSYDSEGNLIEDSA